MLKQEAIDYFGSVSKLAKALGVSRQYIYMWDEFVPELQAYRLQDLTNSKLRVMGNDSDNL